MYAKVFLSVVNKQLIGYIKDFIPLDISIKKSSRWNINMNLEKPSFQMDDLKWRRILNT